jgi:hypothetical protein
MEETAHHFEPTSLVGIYRWRDPRQGLHLPALRVPRQRSARPRTGRSTRKSSACSGSRRRRSGSGAAEHRSPLVQKCVDDFLAGRSFPLDVFSPEFS